MSSGDEAEQLRAENALLREHLAEARARSRELELRLHLRPWTQYLPPLTVPRQRRMPR